MTFLFAIFLAALVFALGFSIARKWPFEARFDNAKSFSLKALFVVMTTICVVTFALSVDEQFSRGVTCSFVGAGVGGFLHRHRSMGVLIGSQMGALVGAAIAVMVVGTIRGERFFVSDILCKRRLKSVAPSGQKTWRPWYQFGC